MKFHLFAVLLLYCMVHFVPAYAADLGLISWFTSTILNYPTPEDPSKAISVLKTESCWHRSEVQALIADFCVVDLSDEGRARLTIALTNCHLEASGFDIIDCPATKHFKQCTLDLGQSTVAYTTYTTFYAHIDSLCYYMQKDLFHKSTSDAVNALYSATLASKDQFAEFHQDMITNQNVFKSKLDAHIITEDERFQSLLHNVSNVQTLLDYISVNQRALSSNTEQVLTISNQVYGKQLATLTSLGLLSTHLASYQYEQSKAHEQTLGQLLLLQDHAKSGFSTINNQYANLSNDIEHSHISLRHTAHEINHELQHIHNHLTTMIQSVFAAITSFHLDMFGLTSYVFYPIVVLFIIVTTSIASTYRVRFVLYLTITSIFLFERLLIRQNSITLIIAHSLLCVSHTARIIGVYILTQIIRPFFRSMFSFAHHSSHGIPSGSSAQYDDTVYPYSFLSSSSSPSSLTLWQTATKVCPSCAYLSHEFATNWLPSTHWASSLDPSNQNSQAFDATAALNQTMNSSVHPDFFSSDESSVVHALSPILTASQHIQVIELIRIITIVLILTILIYSALTYQDVALSTQHKITDVETQMTIFEQNLASFKQWTKNMLRLQIAQQQLILHNQQQQQQHQQQQQLTAAHPQTKLPSTSPQHGLIAASTTVSPRVATVTTTSVHEPSSLFSFRTISEMYKPLMQSFHQSHHTTTHQQSSTISKPSPPSPPMNVSGNIDKQSTLAKFIAWITILIGLQTHSTKSTSDPRSFHQDHIPNTHFNQQGRRGMNSLNYLSSASSRSGGDGSGSNLHTVWVSRPTVFSVNDADTKPKTKTLGNTVLRNQTQNKNNSQQQHTSIRDEQGDVVIIPSSSSPQPRNACYDSDSKVKSPRRLRRPSEPVEKIAASADTDQQLPSRPSSTRRSSVTRKTVL